MKNTMQIICMSFLLSTHANLFLNAQQKNSKPSTAAPVPAPAPAPVPAAASQSSKIDQIKSKAASIKLKAQEIKNSKSSKSVPQSSSPKSSPSITAPVSEKESEEIKSLIEEFKKAADKITCSCGSSKKDKDGKSPEGLERCKHDKDHQKIVNDAYEVYKKLYEAAKKGCISEEHATQVKPSVVKLFECKNIQMMPWLPKKCKQPTAQSTPSKQPTTQSTPSKK
jgi:hypothetical protein